jgi:hypothetical protein
MNGWHTDSGRNRTGTARAQVHFGAGSPGPAAPMVGGCGAMPDTGRRRPAPGIPARGMRSAGCTIAARGATENRTPGPARDPRKSPSDGPYGLTAPAVPGRSAGGRPHAPAPGRNRAYRSSPSVGRGRHGGRNPGPWSPWPYTPGVTHLVMRTQKHREFSCGTPPYGGRGWAKSLIVRPPRPISGSGWRK